MILPVRGATAAASKYSFYSSSALKGLTIPSGQNRPKSSL